MPAKTPIYLKQTTGKNGVVGGKGSKKLREILSTDMISPPLGDFRHMAHVGRGGKEDMFGDTTFLQKKAAPASNGTSETHHNPSGVPNFHSFRRKGTGKNSKKERNSSVPEDSTETPPIFKQTQNGYGPQQSPILQSAMSLPVLNQADSSGPSTPAHSDKDVEVTTGKTTVNNNTIPVKNTETSDVTTTPETHLNGPTKPRRITGDGNVISNGHVDNSAKPNGLITASKEKSTYVSDTNSMDEGWSLELDLGTSLMDDVMGIMDKIEL